MFSKHGRNQLKLPTKKLYSLLCGPLRITHSNKVPFNFLDKSDARFHELHLTLDSVCSELQSKGIGAQTKAAATISYEDEDLFWRLKFLVIVNREFCLIRSSSMLGCISAFVEDKNKETFHFDSLLVFQPMIQSITVIHTMSMLNLFQKTININSETFVWKKNL